MRAVVDALMGGVLAGVVALLVGAGGVAAAFIGVVGGAVVFVAIAFGAGRFFVRDQASLEALFPSPEAAA